ncbi:thioredoxin family protein [bacterium]|nr:thioredoxin family protein [bacterium]MBU1993433.1 thioredoxin family protein [bacterium]
MKTVLKYLISVVLLASALLGAELDWSHDYEAALQQAKKEKKDVYMLVTSADCRWCRKFEATTLQDESILAQLNKKYVLLHIDRDKDAMPEIFKKQRVPRHYFITSEAKIIYSFLGYWNSEDFASFLKDVDKKR